MKKILLLFFSTLSLCFCDSPQQAFELLLNYSKSETSSLRLQYLKDAFMLYRQDISEKISENMQMREKILNGKSEEQLFADSNTFPAGLDFLYLAMASDLARHYTFALESFGKNEFLDETHSLIKKSLIAALSTMVFMQNISSSRTQKTFSLYADLILAQNKAYQALQMHKKP